MKALVLVQSTTVGTYINVFAAICLKYKTIKQIRILYITDDSSSVTIKDIREGLFELSKDYTIYEYASDVSRDSDTCKVDLLRTYIKDWDIVDVTGVSKEVALSVAAASVSKRNVKVCTVNWLQHFKKGERWILTDNNQEYVNLLGLDDLKLLRKDHFQKKHVIIAFGVIFSLLTLIVVLKILFPLFFIPNVVVNMFGLLIGVAGLYLAAISLKNG